jgi:hypothetical protein
MQLEASFDRGGKAEFNRLGTTRVGPSNLDIEAHFSWVLEVCIELTVVEVLIPTTGTKAPHLYEI